MPKDFIFPPTTRYTCLNCGRCCTNWAIKVEDAVAEKLLEYDWGAHYADMKGIEIFVRKKTGLTKDPAYFMKMRKGGRCPFLEDNNFCRIHTDLKYEAKPSGCKLFPLSLSEGPRGIHARMSLYCPAVAANEGKALSAQTRWIAQCYRQSGAEQLGESFYLAEGVPIKWADVLLLEGNLLRLLKEESPRPLQERLAVGGALIETIMSRTANDEPVRMGEFLRDMEKQNYEGLSAGQDQGKPSALRGRLALGLFLIQDTRPTTVARILRIPAMIRFILKLGSLKSQTLGIKASLRKAIKVEFNPGDESREFIVRFLEQKILGKRYIEGNITVEGGWALMCAAYKFAELLSRIRAVSQGRQAVSHEDMVTAVGVTDLLVVEHTVFFQIDNTRRLVHLVLSQPGMYRNVLAAL